MPARFDRALGPADARAVDARAQRRERGCRRDRGARRRRRSVTSACTKRPPRSAATFSPLVAVAVEDHHGCARLRPAAARSPRPCPMRRRSRLQSCRSSPCRADPRWPGNAHAGTAVGRPCGVVAANPMGNLHCLDVLVIIQCYVDCECDVDDDAVDRRPPRSGAGCRQELETLRALKAAVRRCGAAKVPIRMRWLR